ncbi:MAG: hypothetical protein H0W42_04195 [Gemmatimonadaceae bacterium]|nr:hypothetical protein [Gemmatimonadaceae bacterium]
MDGLAAARPDFVRAIIASEWLTAGAIDSELGQVTLRPHQTDAVKRLRAMLKQNGGALLCDDVGLGKTYVALATAREYSGSLVVGPASLRAMWTSAASRAAVPIDFMSMEALSRGTRPERRYDFIIVDEAHHFRTPSTTRFETLTGMAARTKVLLLTATPLHNSRRDISTLLSLFLGATAATLPDSEIARHVVRRNETGEAGDIPITRGPERLAIMDNASALRIALALPSPVPPRDGQVAAAMVAHTLVRLWASSDAALREGLRRRLGRTVAIRSALESGRLPTRREVRDWTYCEGAIQLGFAELLAAASPAEPLGMLEAARTHERGLVDALDSIPGHSQADAERVQAIRRVRKNHPDAKVVAFSQFADTVRMYYRMLARDGRVAMLTSHGGRIAGGSIRRAELLGRFAPNASRKPVPGPAEEISLLLATDMLSEGVNVQDASVVVHLDLPWTAATLDQRVGRVARLGSRHKEVFVYSLDPPASSEELLKAEEIIRRKLDLTVTRVGRSRIPPLFVRIGPARCSSVENAEAIRCTLLKWSGECDRPSPVRPAYAFVAGERDGVLALVSVRGRPLLLASERSELSEDLGTVRGMVDSVGAGPAHANRLQLDSALATVRRWVEGELASEDAGVSEHTRSRLVRRVTLRLARHLAACPHHERSDRAARIADVHVQMQWPLTLGVEREIDAAVKAEVVPGEFLSTLERIFGQARDHPAESVIRLHALLVSVANPLLQPQPTPEQQPSHLRNTSGSCPPRTTDSESRRTPDSSSAS